METNTNMDLVTPSDLLRVSAPAPKRTWEEVTADGVMSVDEFIDKCKKRYEERFGKGEHA